MSAYLNGYGESVFLWGCLRVFGVRRGNWKMEQVAII